VGRLGLFATLSVALVAAAGIAGAAPAVIIQPGSITLPAWSPDGRQIAWIDATIDNAASPASWRGWEAGSDGSHARMIISGPALSAGAWQLDWLAPETLALFGDFSIYVVRIGDKPKLLAANITNEFSSDTTGKHFAYEKSPCGGQCNSPSQVVVINPRTGTRTVVGDKTTHYGDPTISPDGSEVAFTSPNGLLKARTDGSRLQQVTPQSASCPQWSPDGHNIAYIGRNGSLRLVPATGGPSTVLLSHGVGCGYAPLNFGWSPDGKILTVIGTGPRGTRALTLIDIATRQATRLLGFSSVTGFAWSPDSSRLLITARPAPSACSSLWQVDSDGSHPKLIVRCG
jgi:Tol biopolymer transport system component